ncbi:Sau3AI family type II restriction endonuclease [Crassaminicella profunda]|uniref:Sau3AI family type II restriction endonuclease n=1 Tax=Crassaminicella profunda TaxID=1286698 RepID=UPI001CA754E9|nr:Sau3AI family type II restriction endonuclease [Crassaminicella profunda]QZY55963.1 restriction endonuclease [Crassaminicella profunda]
MNNYVPYNKYSPIAIEKYAKRLENYTFKSILPDEYKNYKGKGGLGQLLEKYYFLYEPNSDKNPDFKEAGVELKVSPYKINKNGSYSAKERLVLNIINYMDIVYESFETSTFLHKNKLILLIYYLYEKEINRLDYKINHVQLFSFPESDLKIIKDDWEKIVSKIRQGKAHELSEGDTFYLGACTKGKNKSSLREQPYSKAKSMQRAFSLKNKYMTHVLNDYIVPRRPTYEPQNEEVLLVSESSVNYNSNGVTAYEPIIKDVLTLENTTFESYIINKININKGKSIDELATQYSVKIGNLKNFASKVALKMLGVNSKNALEFEKANIKVKAIRIEKNGKIKEHMSFPTFKFKEIVTQNWEESDFRNILYETKFLFVIFRYDENDVLRLYKGMFWNMPLKDLDTEVKRVWEKTVNVIQNGISTWKKGKREFNNLPSPSENPVSHVRPHAKNKADIYILPDGRKFTKQCFWLNNSYILKQIEKE